MTVDLGKVPFEKAFYFAAKILPGFTLIWVYNIRHPGTILWFFSIPFLGYVTKLALFLTVSFLLGHTFVTLIGTVTGALAGASGAIWASFHAGRHPYEDKVAPWRDRQWRDTYKNYYRDSAPLDLQLVPQEIAEAQLRDAVPFGEGMVNFEVLGQMNNRSTALNETLESILNDKQWKARYLSLHNKIILERGMEIIEEITDSLDSNLAICSITVLFCALLLAPLRKWWLVALSASCIIVGLVRISAKIYSLRDSWSTLSEQIDRLTINH